MLGRRVVVIGGRVYKVNVGHLREDLIREAERKEGRKRREGGGREEEGRMRREGGRGGSKEEGEGERHQ